MTAATRGVGIPFLMMPEYFDEADGVPEHENKKTWNRIKAELPAKATWKYWPKLIGAYDRQCKQVMDTYKECTQGFLYEPGAILRCAAEFAQFRSCLTAVENKVYKDCGDNIHQVYDSYNAGQLNDQVVDNLVHCIRNEVIFKDMSDVKFRYTDNYLKMIETNATNRTGIFKGYDPK